MSEEGHGYLRVTLHDRAEELIILQLNGLISYEL